MVELLLKYAVEADTRDEDQWTALRMALLLSF